MGGVGYGLSGGTGGVVFRQGKTNLRGEGTTAEKREGRGGTKCDKFQKSEKNKRSYKGKNTPRVGERHPPA